MAIDQITKSWARSELAGGRVIEFVGPLQFRLVHNSGSAFGLGDGAGPLIAVMALAAVVGILWYSGSVASIPSLVSVGTIAGGALGNFIDRALREQSGLLSGSVIDFIDVGPWPVFNVADMAITLGGMSYLIAQSRNDG